MCKSINFEDLELTVEKTIKHILQLRETTKAIKENNILKMCVDETVLNFMNGQEFESSLTANETIESTIICGFTVIFEKESPDHEVVEVNLKDKSLAVKIFEVES